MAELLTTKQLQDLLKIDRITVYRMLNDGRLKGVKIGNQWRFPRNEIARLLGEEPVDEETEEIENTLTDFPSDCVQKVQEIYAGIIGIGAVSVTLKGEALTEPTFSNPFCKLMLSNPSSRKACQASWRKIALRTTGQPSFQTCHAGLSYMRSQIEFNDKPAAWMISGQYYITSPDPENEKERLQQLSILHDIPLSKLTEAASKIPVLTKSQQAQVQEWTPKVASTVQSILCERSDLLGRLERIAELSAIQPTLHK
jgi:excisionase family DNA binding protein